MYQSNIENHNYPYCEDSVNQLREIGRSDLRGILERRGHTFNSSGNTNCISPSHEDRNPSMSVTDGQGCYCHSCGFKQKDPITLIQELDKINSYKDAIEATAKEFNFNLISNQSYHKKSNKSINKSSRKPLQDIEIATQPIPDDIPEKVFSGQDQYQTIYPYSQSKWVERLDSNSGKKCIPHHLDSRGCDVCKKGSDQWFPYRIDDIVSYSQEKYPLLLEGEKCVEAARAKGLVSTTFIGSGWSGEVLQQNLEALKDVGIPGVIFWPDNDKPGFDKARKVEEIGDRICLKVIVIDPKSIWSEMPEKGDIVDFLEAHPSISGEGIINRLKLASELQPQKPKTETITPEPEQELPPRERLMLDLQAYLLEKDNPSKALIFAQICREYSLPKYSVESLLLDLDTGSQSRKIRKFRGTQFLNSDVQPVQFLVQGVPIGGVTVLAGAQGKGKTTNAYWLAKCVLDGETYLDDTPSATGGVLIINSDEGLGSSLDRIIDMDFPDDDRWSFWGNFNIDRHFEELEIEVRETRPKLIIIDSFCGIHGEGFDENSSLAGLTINKLNKLAEAYGCAIIVIHHFKGQKG